MNVQRSLFTLNTTTEVPLSKAPNPQLLPGCRSINGCPLCFHGACVFTAVCVHFGWVNCRAQIPSMGNHTWPHVTSRHVTSRQNGIYSLNFLKKKWNDLFGTHAYRTKRPIPKIFSTNVYRYTPNLL